MLCLSVFLLIFSIHAKHVLYLILYVHEQVHAFLPEARVNTSHEFSTVVLAWVTLPMSSLEASTLRQDIP
jgi:hypothetical protein